MAMRKKLPIEESLERHDLGTVGLGALAPQMASKTKFLNAILRLDVEIRQFPYPYSREQYQALFSSLSHIFDIVDVQTLSSMFDHFEQILLELDKGSVHTIVQPSFRPQNRPPLTDGEWSARAYLAIAMRRLVHHGNTVKSAANFLVKEGPWVIQSVGLPLEEKAVIGLYKQFKSGAVKNAAAMAIYDSAPIDGLTIEEELHTTKLAMVRGVSWGTSKHSEAARKHAAEKRAARKPPT